MSLDLATLAAWATIGQLVVGLFALLLQLRDSKFQAFFPIRTLILWLAAGTLTLLLPGVAIFLSILTLLSLFSASVVQEQLLRAMIWTLTAGTFWGIVWGVYILPKLVNWTTKIRRKNEKSN